MIIDLARMCYNSGHETMSYATYLLQNYLCCHSNLELSYY